MGKYPEVSNAGKALCELDRALEKLKKCISDIQAAQAEVNDSVNELNDEVAHLDDDTMCCKKAVNSMVEQTNKSIHSPFWNQDN